MHQPFRSTDLLRLGALASAAVVGTPAEVSLRFGLIFVLLLLTRLIRAPAPFDGALAALLLTSAWASALGWYVTHPWIDIPIHFALTGSTAAMFYLGLLRLDLLPPPERLSYRRGAGLVVLPITLVGATIALVWELYEWAASTYLPAQIVVGYEDTIGDMANGVLGSATAGVGMAWWLAAGRGLGGARPASPHERSGTH